MPLHLIIALDSLTAAHFGRKNYLYMHYRSSSKHNRQDMASIESIRQRAISKLTRKYGKAFVRYLLTPNHTTNALVPPAVRDLTDAIQSSNDLEQLKRFDTAAEGIMGGRIQPTELRRVLRAREPDRGPDRGPDEVPDRGPDRGPDSGKPPATDEELNGWLINLLKDVEVEGKVIKGRTAEGIPALIGGKILYDGGLTDFFKTKILDDLTVSLTDPQVERIKNAFKELIRRNKNVPKSRQLVALEKRVEKIDAETVELEKKQGEYIATYREGSSNRNGYNNNWQRWDKEIGRLQEERTKIIAQQDALRKTRKKPGVPLFTSPLGRKTAISTKGGTLFAGRKPAPLPAPRKTAGPSVRRTATVVENPDGQPNKPSLPVPPPPPSRKANQEDLIARLEECEKLRSENEQLKTKADELEGELTRISNVNDLLKKQDEFMVNQADSQAKKIQEAEKKLNECTELVNELRTSQQSAEVLKTRLKEAQKVLQKCTEKTEKMKAQREREREASSKNRKKAMGEIRKLKKQLQTQKEIREDLAQRLADGDSNTKKAFDECNKKVEDLESLLLSATKDLTKDREDSAKTISDLKAETEKLRMMLNLQITPDEDLELVREELETAEKYLDEFKGIGTLEEIRKRLTDCEGLQKKFKNLQSTLKTTRESLEDKEKELEGKEKELEGKQEQIAKALRTKLDEPAGRGGATSVSKAPELTSECNWGIPSGFVSATDVDKKVTVAKIFEFAQSVQFDPKKILVYSNKSDTGVRNYYCPILSVNIEGANKTVTVNKYGKEVVFYVRNGEGNLTKKDFYVQKKAFSAFLKPDRGVQLQKIKTMLGRPGESKPDAAQKFKKGDIIADSKGTYRVDIVNGDKRLTTVELNDDGDYVNDVNKTRKKRIGDPKKYTKVTTRETSNDSSGPRTRRRNWQFEGLVPALPSIRIPERHEMM